MFAHSLFQKLNVRVVHGQLEKNVTLTTEKFQCVVLLFLVLFNFYSYSNASGVSL